LPPPGNFSADALVLNNQAQFTIAYLPFSDLLAISLKTKYTRRSEMKDYRRPLLDKTD